jgi:FkbM family methyltransferase
MPRDSDQGPGQGTGDARPPRLAFLTLPGLGHFAPDLLRALPRPGVLEVRHVEVRRPADLGAALAWADDPARDALWFEFCWPPFPEMIARADLGGRRVLMRIHRIEAYGTGHAAAAPWARIDDAIVVGEDMARRLRAAAPGLEAAGTRLTVLHNGVDLDRFRPAAEAPDPWRIGWCGWLSLHKNPNLALEILHRLRSGGAPEDARWTLHVATRGGEPVAADSFVHLVRRMALEPAVHVIEGIPQERMAEWHARNAALLSTSVYESFGYAIAEAAAVGCDLAVLDNPGADEFWPEAARFATVDQAVALIRAARPQRWRALVAARFSLAAQAEAVRRLLRQPRSAAVPDDRAADRADGARIVPIGHGEAWRGRFLLRDPDDHIQRQVAASGAFYEAEMLEDLRPRLPPDGLFLDVGANVGNHALFAAGVCGARVIAWEPAEALARHCRDNLALNGLSARVEVRTEGLAEAPSRARLVPGPAGNAGMTRLAAGDGAVTVDSLDAALAAMGDTAAPAAIKVDVEGMEAAVLRGARATLRRHRPAVYVEAATAEAFLAVREVLDPLGYEPVARFNATPTWLFLAEEAGAGDPAAAP